MKEILSLHDYNVLFSPLREKFEYSPPDEVLPVVPTLQVFTSDISEETLIEKTCIKIAISALWEISLLFSSRSDPMGLPSFLNSNDFFWLPEQKAARLQGDSWLKVKAHDQMVLGQIHTNNSLFIHHLYFLPPETIGKSCAENAEDLEKAYVWCVANIIHQIMFKSPAFGHEDQSPMQRVKSYLSTTYSCPNSESILRLYLEKSLSSDPTARPTIHEALEILGKTNLENYRSVFSERAH